MNEIEKLLKEEQREQKRAATGVHGRASRTGKTGRIYMPFELLQGEEAQKYTQPSEVRIYSMYDEILSFDEFQQLSREKQAEVLQKWREEKSAEEIIKIWGISKGKFYNIVRELNLPVGSTRRKTTYKKAHQLEIYQPDTSETEPSDKFILILRGEYEGKNLIDKLMKLSAALDESGIQYRINLEIREV